MYLRLLYKKCINATITTRVPFHCIIRERTLHAHSSSGNIIRDDTWLRMPRHETPVIIIFTASYLLIIMRMQRRHDMSSTSLPYFTSGVVIKGFGRGSKALGIPTANFPEEVVDALPKDLDNGVYYGWGSLDGQVYKMVASIGWNPFYKNDKKSLEVHLLHKFPNDLYGKKLKLIITGYIRAQKDFSSVEELISEIQHDIAVAEQTLEETHMNNFKNNSFLTENI